MADAAPSTAPAICSYSNNFCTFCPKLPCPSLILTPPGAEQDSAPGILTWAAWQRGLALERRVLFGQRSHQQDALAFSSFIGTIHVALISNQEELPRGKNGAIKDLKTAEAQGGRGPG